MKRFLKGLLFGVVGFALGVGIGMGLVVLFSPNTHDKEMEMAMTGFFVGGPLLGLVGFVVGLFRTGKPKT